MHYDVLLSLLKPIPVVLKGQLRSITIEDKRIADRQRNGLQSTTLLDRALEVERVAVFLS